MKQKLITTVAAITFGLLPALAGEPAPEHFFLNAGKIEHITIQNDMEIILHQALAGERSSKDPLVFVVVRCVRCAPLSWNTKDTTGHEVHDGSVY